MKELVKYRAPNILVPRHTISVEYPKKMQGSYETIQLDMTIKHGLIERALTIQKNECEVKWS